MSVSTLNIRRASFLEALADNIDTSMITEHFKKRCAHVRQLESGRMRLQFTDGNSHDTDVVIGADGLKSTVRRFVFGLPEAARDEALVFTRTCAYRGLVPIDELRAAGANTNFLQSLCWFGKDKHLITFPIRDNKILNIVAFTTDYSRPMEYEGNSDEWVQNVPQEEMLKDFEEWGPDVQAMLQRITNPSKWSIHALYPTIDKYVEGKAALIGDAVSKSRSPFDVKYTYDRLAGACHTTAPRCWCRLWYRGRLYLSSVIGPSANKCGKC